MKRFTLFLFAFCFASSTWSQTFTVNGVAYTITDSINKYVAIGTGKATSAISRSTSGKFNIPSSVIYNNKTFTITSIGFDAFAACSSLTSITIPNSVTSIGTTAFAICSSLTSIIIPNSVTSIGDDAFSESGLISVIIPNSVTSIGDGVFENCDSLISITIPNSITSLGVDFLGGCTSLKSIKIPDAVKSIGGAAFMDCYALTSIYIPSSVTFIGDRAFCNCTSLNTVSIPSSILHLGREAFGYCTKLESINSYNANPSMTSLDYDVFYSVPTSTCTLYVPTGSKSLYSVAPQWSAFVNIVEKLNSVVIFISSGSIILQNIKKGTQIHLFDRIGKLLYSNIATSETVSIPVKAKGIYIVKADNVSKKIIY